MCVCVNLVLSLSLLHHNNSFKALQKKMLSLNTGSVRTTKIKLHVLFASHF